VSSLAARSAGTPWLRVGRHCCGRNRQTDHLL